MADTSRNDALLAARRLRAHVTFDDSPRGEAGYRLARTLDQQYFAAVRFRGDVGTSDDREESGFYGAWWPRVHRIVTGSDDEAVAAAHRTALRAGWSQEELAAQGLSPSV
jgi:hypothetical protein